MNNIIWFHLYGISRIGEFTETKSNLEVENKMEVNRRQRQHTEGGIKTWSMGTRLQLYSTIATGKENVLYI